MFFSEEFSTSNRHIGWISTGRVVVLVCLLLVVGCTTSPSQIESLDYQARAETQVDGRVRVSAVVLSPQEAESSFSVPLAKKGIQLILGEERHPLDSIEYLPWEQPTGRKTVPDN